MEDQIASILADPMIIKMMAAGIVLFGTFLIKDFLGSLIAGIMFKINKDFNEGDMVIFNGEAMTIMCIGFRQTKFVLIKDGKMHVQYVYNDRIRYAKLEKVIPIECVKEE